MCVKAWLGGLWTLLIALSWWLYRRHERYCEPFMYSKFAMAEYMVVLVNLCFHATMRAELCYLQPNYLELPGKIV